MASGYVWGIDIGQCGLKALRGQLSADGQSVDADAYDYIEYPQILSQPDANPVELVRAALKTLLSRNDLRGDAVAISLPGQSGLSKFVKLPPVGAKELPQMVQYEAKGQIPFDLEEVVWDYQRMPGEYGAADDEDEDLPMQTEVGLFAIKRDQLFKAIRPLIDADVEIDIIQLAPMAVYNAMAYDQLHGDQPYDDEKGGTWVAALSIGTEAADLVITNGYRVWQRNIPIGGNHFTKQLTQDLKLTFAKAELVKRNARQSEDAKQLFKAMRPVFNDLVTETQRSIGYFGSLERAASVERLVLMGNAAKLPGLPQFLGKNLSMPVDKLRSYDRLTGASVVEDGQFKDNLMAFPVCYGLVLQGLGKSQLASNLVPREIIRSRIIRRKKPWAAAIAAAIMLACAFNFFFQYRGWDGVHPEYTVNGNSWEDADKMVVKFQGDIGRLEQQDTTANETLERLNGLGEATVGSDDGRRLWLELLRTIAEVLPVDPNAKQGGEPVSIKDRPLHTRTEIYIDSIESQYFTDLTVWNTETVKARYQTFLTERQAGLAAEARSVAAAAAGEEAAPDAEEVVDDVVEDVPPDAAGAADSAGEGSAFDAGPGWVIQITGHHFQRSGRTKDKQYIRTTIMEQLENGTIELPGPDGKTKVKFSAKEMGIFSPILVSGTVLKSVKIANPDYRPPRVTAPDPSSPFGQAADPFKAAAAAGKPAAEKEDADNPKYFDAPQYSFVVQFVWKQIPLTQRILERRAKAEAERRARGN